MITSIPALAVGSSHFAAEEGAVPGNRVTLTGTHQTFDCETGQTLLAGMVRSGRAHIPAGCLGGCCGICRVRVRAGRWRASGPMSRAQVSAEDEQAGVVLACRTVPLCAVEIEVLGKRRVA